MPIYNKLVRDRILEIIKANGQKATHRILSADEYAVELTKKLFEEVEEYSRDKNTDELADIMEVVYTLARLHNCTPEELDKLRANKAKKRGGFNEKIFLIEVID
ncbi:phosphoribosyl-ATP pyrophosphohydrolase [TM7 phylum sp. oral taxon 353]|nr:phosphoribosyl-ATP pyrophosphohydrolase [TM7 phylum sp. oral taxon 353]